MIDRPLCGCLDCRCAALTRRLLRVPPPPRTETRPAPTAAELERHAKRFGPELVLETATELGVEVKVERPKRKRGARGLTLKQRVAAHVAKGHGIDVVAELENLSPSRARRLIEEVNG